MKRNLNVSSLFLFFQRLQSEAREMESQIKNSYECIEIPIILISRDSDCICTSRDIPVVWQRQEWLNLQKRNGRHCVSNIFNGKRLWMRKRKERTHQNWSRCYFQQFWYCKSLAEADFKTTFNTKFLRDPTTNLNDPFILRKVKLITV